MNRWIDEYTRGLSKRCASDKWCCNTGGEPSPKLMAESIYNHMNGSHDYHMTSTYSTYKLCKHCYCRFLFKNINIPGPSAGGLYTTKWKRMSINKQETYLNVCVCVCVCVCITERMIFQLILLLSVVEETHPPHVYRGQQYEMVKILVHNIQ